MIHSCSHTSGTILVTPEHDLYLRDSTLFRNRKGFSWKEVYHKKLDSITNPTIGHTPRLDLRFERYKRLKISLEKYTVSRREGYLAARDSRREEGSSRRAKNLWPRLTIFTTASRREGCLAARQQQHLHTFLSQTRSQSHPNTIFALDFDQKTFLNHFWPLLNINKHF